LRLLFAFLLLACASGPGREEELLPEGPRDARIQEACAVTARSCTRCHELNRIVAAKLDSPREWKILVERMRLMPSSNISQPDADQATQCLVYRAYGPTGLAALAEEDSP
jgi:hypothetical protein